MMKRRQTAREAARHRELAAKAEKYGRAREYW